MMDEGQQMAENEVSGQTSPDPHYFVPNDLGTLQDVAEKVEEVSAVARARVVVAVWDRGDNRPVAWIEMHPEDSDPTVRFSPEQEADDAE